MTFFRQGEVLMPLDKCETVSSEAFLEFWSKCTVPFKTSCQGEVMAVILDIHLVDPKLAERWRGGFSDSQIARLLHHATCTWDCIAPELYRRWLLVSRYEWMRRDLQAIFAGEMHTWFAAYHVIASEMELEQVGEEVHLLDYGVLDTSEAREVFSGLHDDYIVRHEAGGEAIDVRPPPMTVKPVPRRELYVRQHLYFLLRWRRHYYPSGRLSLDCDDRQLGEKVKRSLANYDFQRISADRQRLEARARAAVQRGQRLDDQTCDLLIHREDCLAVQEAQQERVYAYKEARWRLAPRVEWR